MIKKWMSYVVLVILIIVNLVSAESIDLNYPENVVVGEEFNINLVFNDFNEDIYSVKIDILDGSNHLAQRFWDNGWYQNRWMYNASNTSETNSFEFDFRISEDFEGVADIVVKIKSDNYNEATFIGNTIYINLSSSDLNPNPEENNEAEIDFDFEWDEDEIINIKEFEIDIDGFNLEDEKYDVKVWIQNDKDEIISEIYDEDEEKWKSGQYYVNEILEGTGNDSDRVELRLKENYRDFIGDAQIFIKIRDEGNSVVYEDDENIDILENEDEELEENLTSDDEELMERAMELRQQMTESQNSNVSGQVIRLGSVSNENNLETETIKTKNSIIYESSTEKIKKYSVFGFAFLCMMLCILLILEKL